MADRIETGTRSLVDLWRGARVVVIGDLILDKFEYHAKVGESREHPGVPETRQIHQYVYPGGAGNTIGNITSLGGRADLLSVVGTKLEDRDRRRNAALCDALQRMGVNPAGLIPDRNRPTTRKARFFIDDKFIYCGNDEDRSPINEGVRRDLFTQLERIEQSQDLAKDRVRALIVSDYGRGVVIPELMRTVREWCKEKNIPLVIDPRPRKEIPWRELYAGATLVKPNVEEAHEMLDRRLDAADDSDITKAACELRGELGGAVLITRDRYGMTLADDRGEVQHLRSSVPSGTVRCVSGCGDTVVAVIALALSTGRALVNAVQLANVAAGIAVKKQGTATVAATELKAELDGQ